MYHHGTQDGAGALATTGTVQVTPTTAGSYYIAFLANNGYVEMATRINIAVVPAPGPFTYVGCYNDNDGGRDMGGGAPSLRTDAQVPFAAATECAGLCSGFAYFGLQWTNECFCDNTYHNGYGNNNAQANCPDGVCPITDCDADGVLDADGTADLCGNGVANCGDRNAVYCIGAC